MRVPSELRPTFTGWLFFFPLRNAQGACWLTTHFKLREPTTTFSNTPVQSPEHVTASPDLEIPTHVRLWLKTSACLQRSWPYCHPAQSQKTNGLDGPHATSKGGYRFFSRLQTHRAHRVRSSTRGAGQVIHLKAH
jgi:hypothetical protein